MGLTIHYSLKAPGNQTQARALVDSLHQTAQDLPFEQLGPVVELAGEQCDAQKHSSDDRLRWLLIQATGSVEFKSQGRSRSSAYSTWYNVAPSRLIAFDTWPGEGCEAANFGLGQYPPVIQTGQGPLRTGLSGWRWSSFCKTQYASDPKCGGVANFLRCHLTIIAMLDRAKALGCLDQVSDEGDFWQNRSLPALVQEIGSWNEMIAGFGGLLKDLVGDGPLRVESAITEFPNFEQLEAAGRDELPPGYKELARLIARVGAMQEQAAGAGRQVTTSKAEG